MAKISPQDAQHLKTLLQKQVNTANAVLEKLKYEREALEQRNFDAITLLQKDKHSLLAQLNDAEATRQQLVKNMELDLGQAGFDEFCNHVPHQWRNAFIGLWEERKDLLARCRDANEINGRVLYHTHQASERIMATLRGQNSTQFIYNAKGGKGYVQGPRQLAVA
jgi:flagella synthesis protein FlgN